MAYDGEVHSVKDLLAKFEELKSTWSYKSGLLELHHAHVRLWFRGHSRDGWELQPSVYRPDFPAKDEASRLLIEQHMTQDFRVLAAGLLTGRETEADLYFLQQHYRMPTRLLDWTNSPLVALFFAVTKNSDSDGELFVMDAYQFPKQENFEGIATGRNETFKEALHPIFRWQEPYMYFPDFIMPVRPDHFDHRMSLQLSCFTFHVPERPVLTKVENATLNSFLIPGAAKQRIKEELSLLGIDDFSVFGDLESLSRRLKVAHGVPVP